MPSFVALQQSPRHVARWERAQQDFLNGRYDRAAETYNELLRQFPDTAGIWFELGLAAAKRLEFTQADQAFRRVVELSPQDVSMLVLVGQQYHQLRQLDRARNCFEQAAAAQPTSLHAQLSLADWYERERRLHDAWERVEICARHHPHDPQLTCVRAKLLHRLKRPDQAETLLRDIIRHGQGDLNVRYSSRHQLAALLDEQGNYQEAWTLLMEAKKLLLAVHPVSRMLQDYDRGVQRRRQLLTALNRETICRWSEQAAPNAGFPQLAFLGGHPRSGTTLLEQILGAHPSLFALDESPAFIEEITDKLAPLTSPVAFTLRHLEGLTVPQRDHYRNRYFRSLLRTGPPPVGTVVMLDKNPSLTAQLHQWLRLWPKLKVVIALRDPRDVLVSTFFLNVRVNPTSVNFLTIERTARHYADLMDVWLRLRDLGGFDWMESRYEDVVADVAAEGCRVTEFLGLPWDPTQASSHEKAKDKFVFAPTYNAVTQPVHNRALGRWRNYAEALAPVQSQLAKYCQAFGYE